MAPSSSATAAFCLKDSLCFGSREDGSRVYCYLKLGINEGLEDVLRPFDILSDRIALNSAVLP